jgi:hypothetical protein
LAVSDKNGLRPLFIGYSALLPDAQWDRTSNALRALEVWLYLIKTAFVRCLSDTAPYCQPPVLTDGASTRNGIGAELHISPLAGFMCNWSG